MRYAFLEHCIRCAEVGRHAALPVTRACHLLGVSVSGFYAWRNSDKEHRFGVVDKKLCPRRTCLLSIA